MRYIPVDLSALHILEPKVSKMIGDNLFENHYFQKYAMHNYWCEHRLGKRKTAHYFPKYIDPALNGVIFKTLSSISQDHLQVLVQAMVTDLLHLPVEYSTKDCKISRR